MMELTEEQRLAVHASPEPVTVLDTKSQEAYVLLRADVYQRLKDLLEEVESDRQEQKAWLDVATKTRRRWVRENPY